jgi:penicillin amidase
MSDQLREMARPSLFPVEGTLALPGLDQQVTIRRDPHGVPRIDAETLDDLWFAHGVVTAGERLFQLELALRAATGRLSEIFGERTLDEDRFIRTIGLHRAASRHLEAWSSDDHRMHARFRAGLRAWLDAAPAKPIEYALLDLEPDIPDDPRPFAATFAYLAWTLSGNWESELMRAELDDRIGRDSTDLLMPRAPAARGQGSNDWAVAGSKTVSGAPLLANDPHLLVAQPGPWLEVHLCAPGYEARGVALPFAPGVVLGATPHHAWGVTNVTGDVQDLYEERLNDEGTAALHGDVWEPLVERVERISVRGEPEERTVTVRETRHGPIVPHGTSGILHTAYRPLDRTYALRWTGHEVAFRPTLTLDVARARDVAAFRKAVLKVGCPGQNFVYADVDGTIAYQCTGLHPIRRNGDGSRPVPGWTDDHEWDAWIPLDELPWEVDPERGYLATANHDIQPEGYPYLISTDFHRPIRKQRIDGLLETRDDHDVGSMRAIQMDTSSAPARELVPLLVTVEPRSDGQAGALKLLGDWDGDLAAGGGGAAPGGRAPPPPPAPRSSRSSAESCSRPITAGARPSNAPSCRDSSVTPPGGSTTTSCSTRSTRRSNGPTARPGASSTDS